MELSKLVFGFDIDVLTGFVRALRTHGYSTLQYIPLRQSVGALWREPGNVLNLFRRRTHRAFATSGVAGLYRVGLRLANQKLALCLDACFFTQWVEREALEACFGPALIERGIENGVLRRDGTRLQFTVSFVPFDDDILIRDPFYAYPPATEAFEGRIWMGSDSMMFATFLRHFLQGMRFDAALEIGSGSGIQILVASRFARTAIALDYNERAVQFTKLNAQLNGVEHLRAFSSNLYENLDGTFDLILANPWYCDLDTGGLEEIPGIMDGLNRHLQKDGVCVMLVNSYVKRGRDMVADYLQDVAVRRRYDLELRVDRYGIETDRLAAWKQHGIEYNIMYYVILRRAGTGNVRRYDCPPLRRVRNFTRIRAIRALHRVG